MTYAERILQPDERIRHRARLHWILMLPGILLTAASVVVGFVALLELKGGASMALLALSCLLFLVGGARLLAAWITRLSTEIIVTNRRIIPKAGLFSRRTREMNLDKVESVQVDQSLIGRMLDYGTLVIRGVGAGLEPLANIAHPLEMHRQINASG